MNKGNECVSVSKLYETLKPYPSEEQHKILFESLGDILKQNDPHTLQAINQAERNALSNKKCTVTHLLYWAYDCTRQYTSGRARCGGYSLEHLQKLITDFVLILERETLNCESVHPTAFFKKADIYTPFSMMCSLYLQNAAWTYPVIETLLTKGASPDYGRIFGTPIFMEFGWKRVLPMCELLIPYVKNPNVPDAFGLTAVHVASASIILTEAGYLQKLLELGADVHKLGAQQYNPFAETPLHKAVLGKNALAVELLLKAGANPNQFRTWPFKGQPDPREYGRKLTPAQLAVSLNDPDVLLVFKRWQQAGEIKIASDLHPDEQSRHWLEFMQRGQTSLDVRVAASQFQLPENLLTEIETEFNLRCYVSTLQQRKFVAGAIRWLCTDSTETPAAKYWRPVLQVWLEELTSNHEFCITVGDFATEKKQTCYNNDTQSDIYLRIYYSQHEYAHILAHEVGHLFSYKHQPRAFLEQFLEAFKQDQELMEGLATIPSELRELLIGLSEIYPEDTLAGEYFTRCLVQFPIKFVLNHPECKQQELDQLMQAFLPHSMRFYQEQVLDYDRQDTLEKKF